MILQTLTTLLLTLSMGISANTNDFNDEKKSHKNIDYEQVPIYINEEYEHIGEQTNYTENGYTIYQNKYKIENSNANYVYNENPYIIIANTTYTFNGRDSTKYYFRQCDVLNITNLYNSQISIVITTRQYYVPSLIPTSGQTYKSAFNLDQNVNLVNLTMTDNTQDYISQYLTEENRFSFATTNETQNEVQHSITITLSGNETRNIVMQTNRYNTEYQYQSGNPENILIQGTTNIPTATYEVIDIPNLIFTILSMPFTFVSQAFNLTIFPNTPYQINFSNLFMTILAIFILLWLIRHIFGK